MKIFKEYHPIDLIGFATLVALFIGFLFSGN